MGAGAEPRRGPVQVAPLATGGVSRGDLVAEAQMRGWLAEW